MQHKGLIKLYMNLMKLGNDYREIHEKTINEPIKIYKAGQWSS